jgi:hypothetical protein
MGKPMNLKEKLEEKREQLKELERLKEIIRKTPNLIEDEVLDSEEKDHIDEFTTVTIGLEDIFLKNHDSYDSECNVSIDHTQGKHLLRILKELYEGTPNES